MSPTMGSTSKPLWVRQYVRGFDQASPPGPPPWFQGEPEQGVLYTVCNFVQLVHNSFNCK